MKLSEFEEVINFYRSGWELFYISWVRQRYESILILASLDDSVISARPVFAHSHVLQHFQCTLRRRVSHETIIATRASLLLDKHPVNHTIVGRFYIVRSDTRILSPVRGWHRRWPRTRTDTHTTGVRTKKKKKTARTEHDVACSIRNESRIHIADGWISVSHWAAYVVASSLVHPVVTRGWHTGSVTLQSNWRNAIFHGFKQFFSPRIMLRQELMAGIGDRACDRDWSNVPPSIQSGIKGQVPSIINHTEKKI